MITLAEISALAHALVAADREVDSAEQALREAKEKARQLREESLPMAMLELGVETLTLNTGEKVSVKQDVFAAIAADQRSAAFDWLEQHGFGGLIKTELELKFGRDEQERMQEAATLLRAEGYQPEIARNVHPQTLKAFLREQLEAGNPELPLDLFGARPIWTAKITQAKG
jgi:non-ribosomal peptide synthetase component F